LLASGPATGEDLNPMNMKKLISTLIFLTTVVFAFAQRVDLDKFNFTAIYRNFPADPLKQEYKTYNVRIEAAPSVQSGVNMAYLYDGINIEGLKKVPGTGHVTIIAMLDDILVEKTETRERLDIKKDKAGNEVKKTMYSVEMTYTFSARATVYDYKGNTILDNYSLYSRDNKNTYKTPEYESSTDAVNQYNNKLMDTRASLTKKLVNTAVSNLNSVMNNNYGYTIQRVSDILWILNNKRHIEYDGHQKAWNSFRNAIVLMSADEPLDKVKEKMQPAIDYFEKIKTKYTTSSKDDRKLRYASYYNLAKIYIYLDDPQSAIREAEALAMNDFDESDGRSLRAVAESLEELFKQNQTRTRHFAMDVRAFEPPVK
jgi:hypothetical protein